MIPQFARVALVAIVAVGLGACASAFREARDVTPRGTDFDRALHAEYVEYARFEREEMRDFEGADLFSRRALMAAVGESPAPMELSDWRLTPFWRAEIGPARARLMTALDGTARSSHPQDAAIAQSRLECWMEQAEENIQFDHIARCRSEFEAAMGRIEAAAPAAAPAPPPVAAAPTGPWVVYFDFDRSEITYEGQLEINKAWKAADDNPNAPMVVMGHTDLASPADYNLGLSQRRARAVVEVLDTLGIDTNRITVGAVGQTQPAVPTPDGVREPLNRRVEIRLVN